MSPERNPTRVRTASKSDRNFREGREPPLPNHQNAVGQLKYDGSSHASGRGFNPELCDSSPHDRVDKAPHVLFFSRRFIVNAFEHVFC